MIDLRLGDCLQLLKELPDKSVDLVLTDPPYGIGRGEGFEGFGGFGTPIARRRYENGEWDEKRPDREAFEQALRIGRNAIIFGGNFFTDILPVSNHWIVWDKKNTMPTFGDCELAWTNYKRNSVKMVSIVWNGLIGREAERHHPTQKPVSLMAWILERYTQEGDTILDPFMGSGTTGVACVNLNRSFIGMEIDEKYYQLAKDRIEAAQKGISLQDLRAGQKSLFEGSEG